jgi:hypothetical protein
MVQELEPEAMTRIVAHAATLTTASTGSGRR